MGLHDFSALAIFMYQKEVLLLQPETMQMAFAIIGIPWCIKPVFGYLVDQLIRKVKYTKLVIIFAEFVRMCTLTYLAHYQLNVWQFYGVIFTNSMCSMFENIISEYILVKSSKKENEKENKSNANHLPIFFGFRAAGALIANFFGGRVVHYYSINTAFMIVSYFPVLLIVAAMFYRELPLKPMSEARSFSHELSIMKDLLFRNKVLQMMIFVGLINFTPSFDVISTFYMTDRLGFTTEDLANFSTVSTIAYIIGLLVYSYFLKDIDPKKFFVSTNFVLWMINVSFLLVVTETLTHWGINNKFFCILNQGAYAFVAEINGMPILAIWCSICPKNLEATSITLFTGLLNLSGNISNYLGVGIMWLMNIHKENLNRLWVLIVIQNIYLLLAITAIIFVKFPNPSEIQPETLEEVKLSSLPDGVECD